MKKALFTVLLLLIILPATFAQNNDSYLSTGKQPSEQQMINLVVEKTLQVLRVINVPRLYVKTDSLKNIDTAKVSNDGLYKTLQFVLTDTSSSTVDTIVVQRYDTLSASYSESVGIKDLSTNTIASSDTVILAAGATKTFVVNEDYPFTYRFIRRNTIAGATLITIWRKE